MQLGGGSIKWQSNLTPQIHILIQVRSLLFEGTLALTTVHSVGLPLRATRSCRLPWGIQSRCLWRPIRTQRGHDTQGTFRSFFRKQCISTVQQRAGKFLKEWKIALANDDSATYVVPTTGSKRKSVGLSSSKDSRNMYTKFSVSLLQDAVAIDDKEIMNKYRSGTLTSVSLNFSLAPLSSQYLFL